MNKWIATAALGATLAAAACDSRSPVVQNSGPVQTGQPGERVPSALPTSSVLRWESQSSGEGAALVLIAGTETAVMRLYCPSGERALVVNVRNFQPVGSEERMAFGRANAIVTLVAGSKGDAERGGVTGTGAVPGELGAILSAPISASYGRQVSGPHPPPPRDDAARFVEACAQGVAAVAPTPAAAGACRMQDGREIAANRLRAVGTEPFWGARIEGRCVTYSHPEDQSGTRVWTRFQGTGSRGSWSGALGGQPFVLTTRPEAGCSDGMSDKRFPIAVELKVGGELRRGCAEPL